MDIRFLVLHYFQIVLMVIAMGEIPYTYLARLRHLLRFFPGRSEGCTFLPFGPTCYRNIVHFSNRAVLAGRWCSECKREETQKSALKEMRGIAISRGGKCLSGSYISSQTKLEWECCKKHRWLATSNNIKKGTWCPYCRNRSN